MTAMITSAGSVLNGIRPVTLARYLAGLGLVRVLGEQADPDLLALWTEDGLVIHSRVVDLADWLVTSYRPTPILSPWNGGSGFGAKDKTSREVLDRLIADSSERLAGFRAAYTVAEPLAGLAAEHKWSKERLVTELRNRCPEELLPWLDAAIVLRDQAAATFPPLLGTGGNDGRFDFSTNFHQRLFDVLPDLGAPPARSRQWAAALLTGIDEAPLINGAIGQFSPGAAGGPNSSFRGAANSVLNPWEFVLLFEGAMCFASGVARREGAAIGRATMPFCVFGSPDGPTPGADGEQSRGEIWAPLWRRGMRPAEVAQLFAESRASWQGEIAVQSAHMYAALRSYGVARGIDSFVRFGLLRRNGLAFAAVRLDEVEVSADANIDLSVAPERIAQAQRRVQSGSVKAAVRRFRRSHLAFVRDLEPASLRDMLADLTLADLAISRSSRSRNELGWHPPLPRAAAYAQSLAAGLPRPQAFRIAAAFASGSAMVGDRRMSVRDLLLGAAPRRPREEWSDPAVPGLGVRGLAEILAELVRWRAQQEDEPGTERGFRPFPRSTVRADWSDVHDWVERPELDAEVYRNLLACLALDWRDPGPARPAGPVTRPPIPELALLQGFASGRLGIDGSYGVVHQGLDRSWPARLLADRTAPGEVSSVLSDVARRLVQLGWSVATPRRSRIPAARLVAALATRSSLTPLLRIGAVPPATANALPASDHDIPQPDQRGNS